MIHFAICLIIATVLACAEFGLAVGAIVGAFFFALGCLADEIRAEIRNLGEHR